MKTLQDVANCIWKHGESKIPGEGVLVPSGYADRGYDGDDELLEKYEYNVTHYDIAWAVKGKSVRVRLYSGDCYGACTNIGNPVQEVIVDV